MARKIAIIISDYNRNVTQKMLEFALNTAKKLNLSVSLVVHVPGAFEIPLAMKKVLKSGNVDGVVTLGVVLQGDTDHDIVVSHYSAAQSLKLSLKYNIPLGYGVMGPRMKKEMAPGKAEEYSARAVETVAYMMELMKPSSGSEAKAKK